MIAHAPIIETINDTQIGLDFRNNPNAIPPKATCDIASPNKENLFNIRNNPISEQLIEIAIPAIRARCMNSYWRISIITIQFFFSYSI
jgi:hypothetical protein